MRKIMRENRNETVIIRQIAGRLGIDPFIVADMLGRPWCPKGESISGFAGLVNARYQYYACKFEDPDKKEELQIVWEEQAMSCTKGLKTLEEMMEAFYFFPPNGQAGRELLMAMIRKGSSASLLKEIIGLQHPAYSATTVEAVKKLASLLGWKEGG
jgi:hypothetical protein